MNLPMLLVEANLGWFFLPWHVFVPPCRRPPGHKLRFSNLLRFSRADRKDCGVRDGSGFSMVALLLVVRLQAGLPLVLEAIVAVEFLIFSGLADQGEKPQREREGEQMRPLWEVADFVRSMRRQNAVRRVLSVSFAAPACGIARRHSGGATGSCGPPDIWDDSLRRATRDHKRIAASIG